MLAIAVGIIVTLLQPLRLPALCGSGVQSPSDHLKQIHVDSLVFTGEGLRHLVAEAGASHVVIGSDHPLPWEEHPVDHVMNSPLTDAGKDAILGLNSARLLNIRT